MRDGLLVIRRPAVVDVDAMARIHNDGWRDTYSEWLASRFYDDEALARRAVMWEDVTRRPPAGAVLRVAEQAGSIVGLGAAGVSRDAQAPAPLQLFSLYVASSAQGQGVGSALLADLLGTAAAHCWVAAPNHRAINFYRHHGFRPNGVVQADPDLDGLSEISLSRGVQWQSLVAGQRRR